MPPSLKQLIQGQPFDYSGKSQTPRSYLGGAPCIFTSNYDIRKHAGGLIPPVDWLKENVIFINMRKMPMWLKEGEKDKIYQLPGKTSTPKTFKEMQRKLEVERIKHAATIIQKI